MKKKAIATISIIAWTLICVYSTYYNTIEHAEVTSITKDTYDITYWNTGETHTYNR